MILQIWYFCNSTLTSASQWYHGLVHSPAWRGSCKFKEARKLLSAERATPQRPLQVGRPVSLDEAGGGDHMQDSHAYWPCILLLLHRQKKKVLRFEALDTSPTNHNPGAAPPIGQVLLVSVSPLKTSHIDLFFGGGGFFKHLCFPRQTVCFWFRAQVSRGGEIPNQTNKKIKQSSCSWTPQAQLSPDQLRPTITWSIAKKKHKKRYKG